MPKAPSATSGATVELVQNAVLAYVHRELYADEVVRQPSESFMWGFVVPSPQVRL